MAPNKTVIKGERITVRATMRADLPELLGLWNDGRVMKWVGFPDGMAYDLRRIFNWHVLLQNNPNRWHFVIGHPQHGFCGELFYDTGRLVGFAALDIKLRPEMQGQGFGTEALQLLIDLVFRSELAVQAVYTEPNRGNDRSEALYARCGLHPAERPLALPPADSFWVLYRNDWQVLRADVLGAPFN